MTIAVDWDVKRDAHVILFLQYCTFNTANKMSLSPCRGNIENNSTLLFRYRFTKHIILECLSLIDHQIKQLIERQMKIVLYGNFFASHLI